MFIGALLWLYRIDKDGLMFLISMVATPILIMSLIALAFIFMFAAKLFDFVGLSLWWIGLIIIPLSIKAISYLYQQQHQKPKTGTALEVERLILQRPGMIKRFFLTTKSNIEKTEDIFLEIILVTTNRWLFAFYYCVLILVITAITSLKLSPSPSQQLNLIQIAVSVTICLAICPIHFRYLNRHAKKLYAMLKEFSASLEKNNQYLIWYGTRNGLEVLYIEDKPCWQRDFLVKSEKFGSGFWLSPAISFDSFVPMAKYIKQNNIEALHEALNS